MTITETPLKNQPPTIRDTKTAKRAAYREWRDKVAQLLQDKHFYKEAERWDYCDDSPRYVIDRNKIEIPPSAETVWVCSAASDHDAVLFSSSCDMRICPDCASTHSARLLRRYMPIIAELMTKHPSYRLRTLTFTRSIDIHHPDFAKIASNGFGFIQKAMIQVVGKNWNKNGAGLIANWEIGSNGLKLHYHAIYFGNWVDQKRLSNAWKKLTGGDYVVWVAAVKHNDGDWQGAVSETLKYATKFYKEDKATRERMFLDPEIVIKLFLALKNTRRIRSYGSLYRLGDEEEQPFCCSDCNAKMIKIGIEYFEIWRETGFTPEGWKESIRNSLLQYRTADKYMPITAKKDNLHPKSTRLLPGFDTIPDKRTSHFYYE